MLYTFLPPLSCYMTLNDTVLICCKQMDTVFTPGTLTSRCALSPVGSVFIVVSNENCKSLWNRCCVFVLYLHVCVFTKGGLSFCICFSRRIRICCELIHTKMRFTSQLPFVIFFTKCNRNPVMGFGNAFGRTQATYPMTRLFIARHVKEYVYVSHMSFSFLGIYQTRKVPKTWMDFLLCTDYNWIMLHGLKRPTNPVWHLMEFLISVNKVLIYWGLLVRGRFVMFFFFLSSYEYCGTVPDVTTICCCTHSV